MTDLDDALSSSAPVYYPATLEAAWQELPPGEEASGNADTMRMLGAQIGPGGYTVTHSLDDGLPDPITMTTSNDASGVMEASLLGRPGVYADTIAWRTNAAGGTGTGTSFTATLPTDTTWGDYSVVAIAVNSDTVTVSDANADASIAYGWQLLGTQSDGSGLKVWLWGRDYYATGGGLSVALSASASYSWVSGSVSARTANGLHYVPIRPGTLVTAAESVSQTSHPSPSADLDRRGYLVGVWARVGGAAGWTPGTGTTEINEAGSTVDVALTTSALRGPGSGGLTATTSVATAVAVMMTLPLRIMDRAFMTARSFFSPLNRDSPMYGWNRDTADVALDFNVLTASGPQGVQIFQGQMADVSLSGDEAKMPAVSKTRIALNAVAPLPAISRRREGCTVDTVITWLMAQGGVYVGPGPSDDTRLWYPMYDSVHGFMDGPLGYGGVYEERTADGGIFGVSPPESIPGPFVSAMMAHSDTVSTRIPIIQTDRKWPTAVPGRQGHMHDVMSLQNSKGRMSFWIRGDAYTANPWVVANDTGRDHIFYWRITNQNKADVWQSGVSVRIRNDRRIRVMMGDLSGLTYVDFVGSEIPTDGEWHFVGVSWDWVGQQCRVQVDGWTSTASGYGNNSAYLPATEAKLYADGGYMFSQISYRLPVSDAQFEAGPECWSGVAFTDFERFWPEALDSNAIYRRIGTYLEAVIGSEGPVSSWETLAEMARNTLSSYRCDELDRYCFLPLDYFGETEQMTPETVADTELNAGELDVWQDPSKLRNVVTLNYKEARVDSNRQVVLEITSAVYLPRGTSFQTFPLEVPIVEVHGAVGPYIPGDPFDLYRVDPGELLAPTTIPETNWMSVNSRNDGTGTQVSGPSVFGYIVAWTSTSITVKFINNQPVHMWLSHTVNNLPFLRIYGYAVRSTDAYTTIRSQGSVRARGERALSSDMNWIQSRADAENLAGKLLNIVSRPRPEMSLRVVGDPRRQPGKLVTVEDSAETQADGTWRILSIKHNGDGPQYTQDLRVVRVNPVLIWGESPGWGEAVWG